MTNPIPTAPSRAEGKSVFINDQDREYARDLLSDLDIKAVGPQLEITSQWFCKARVESSRLLAESEHRVQAMLDTVRAETIGECANLLEMRGRDDLAAAVRDLAPLPAPDMGE